jgi:hypothetical protein
VKFDWDDASCFIGFPPPGIDRLHGCTKIAAKRRMKVLLQRLDEENSETCDKSLQNIAEADMQDERKIACVVVSPSDESGRITPTLPDIELLNTILKTINFYMPTTRLERLSKACLGSRKVANKKISTIH